ncbi:MAG: hypothetical protein KJ025_06290 [Burkholderiales bacterium]|nr:hypothetical protein [Burkholderiales bacterium]
MFPLECPFCQHVNPTRARFCGECGSPLYLAPCRCGAYNHVNDTHCYCCGVRLRTARTPADAVDAPPVADPLDQRPVGLDEQARWVEQELRRLEEAEAEPDAHAQAEALGAAPDPAPLDADRTEAGGGSGASEEEAGTPAPAAGAHDEAPRDAIAPASGRSARGPLRREPRALARGAAYSGPGCVSARLPEGRWLFADFSGASSTRWEERVAGLLAALVVVAAVAGGYVYYHTHLAPTLTVNYPDASATEGPTAVAMPMVAKDATSYIRSQEPLPDATPTKSVVAAADPEHAPRLAAARASDAPAEEAAREVPQGVLQEVAQEAAQEAVQDVVREAAQEAVAAAATHADGNRAAEAALQAVPASASAPICPPAVAALALCDWAARALADADRNAH